MSALGQKQTSRGVQTMSALPPKADMRRRTSGQVVTREQENRWRRGGIWRKGGHGALKGTTTLYKTPTPRSACCENP